MKIRLSFLVVIFIALALYFHYSTPSIIGGIIIENTLEKELNILITDLLELKTKLYKIPAKEHKSMKVPVEDIEFLKRKKYLVVAIDEEGLIYHNEYVNFSNIKGLFLQIIIKDIKKKHINSSN